MRIATIENKNVSDLKLWDKNPRSIKEDRYKELKKSIEELGFNDVLKVAADGTTVIGGNMRLRALQELGVANVNVVMTQAKTDKDILKVALRDNEEFGYYDQDAVVELAIGAGFDRLELESFELNLASPTKLSLMVDRVSPEIEEDEVPEVSSDPAASKLGEVYQLGRHRVMCGDSIDRADLNKLMGGNKADMVFTDPPYGMDYSGRGKETNSKILGDNQDPSVFYNLGSEIAERYVWGRVENYKHLEVEPRDTIIWKKNNFGMGSGYRGQYECCFYYGTFSGSDSDVWELPKEVNYQHPTQKPVTLCARAIQNSQPKVVIDYFLGSGSTLMACEQTNRVCYGMELDPKYVDVIRKRYAKHIGEEERWQEVTPAIQSEDRAK